MARNGCRRRLPIIRRRDSRGFSIRITRVYPFVRTPEPRRGVRNDMQKAIALSVISLVVLAAMISPSHANPPATQPSADTAPAAPSAEQLMSQMLKSPPAAPKPLQPKLDAPRFNITTGVGGVIKTPVMADAPRRNVYFRSRRPSHA